MTLQAVETWLAWANAVAILTLSAALLRSELYRTYRFFLIYIGADLIQRVLWVAGPGKSQVEYISTEAVKLVLIGLAIPELLRAAFDRYLGLAEFLQRISSYLALASGIAGALLAGLDPSLSFTKSHLLSHFYTLERSVFFTLLGYLVLVSLLMGWFPVRIRRNVAIFLGSFGALFLCQCADLLLLNRSQHNATWLSVVTLTVTLACATAWIISIRAEAADTIAVSGFRWNSATVDQLTDQLESINMRLSRLSRAVF
jgi:hypothetical protein